MSSNEDPVSPASVPDHGRLTKARPLRPRARTIKAELKKQAPLPSILKSEKRTQDESDQPPAVEWGSESSLIERQTYMLQACRALINYGAPTHRLETYMRRTADALDLHVQAFYLPNCMIIAFDDSDVDTPSRRSFDVQIVTCAQDLNLAKLSDTHRIYKNVIHRNTGAKEATALLEKLFAREEQHSRWLRVLMYGMASACIGPVGYDARPIDLPIIFLLGCLVGLLDLLVATKSSLGCVLEMSSAILISFTARALGSFTWGEEGHNFCFSAIAQSSVVMILPGFTIASSALELQSKMMLPGAVRLVYGIIYTLFLAFGFIVGITVYGAFDPAATSDTQCRHPWPFWWQLIFVLPFTLCYVIIGQAKWKQMPAMLCITMAGWLVSHFSGKRFPTVQAFPTALGALTVGVLSSIYSRFARGLAVVVMHPGIFILVPGSFAVSGSLIEGLHNANDVIHDKNKTEKASLDSFKDPSALYAGYAMVEIAIGIAAGLALSAMLMAPIRWKKNRTPGRNASTSS
ncbi:DUF1212 domain membrane protein [Zymoseptoria brevis]|uniref:DUF1212 domain membrane protein n=1 Tax=Zymoseptoria brevis TaxID=1047168 RepID=A0A0F4GB95_9PEZI|nr:DUF1212 domain membrane protein [Zymoseptoria brevis]